MTWRRENKCDLGSTSPQRNDSRQLQYSLHSSACHDRKRRTYRKEGKDPVKHETGRKKMDCVSGTAGLVGMEKSFDCALLCEKRAGCFFSRTQLRFDSIRSSIFQRVGEPMRATVEPIALGLPSFAGNGSYSTRKVGLAVYPRELCGAVF